MITDPATLHKYMYAGGDPVNAKDPTGREAIAETAELDFWQATKDAVALTVFAAAVSCSLNKSGQTIGGIAANMGNKMFFQSTGLCTEKVFSCKTVLPDLVPIGEVPSWYEFESKDQAVAALTEQANMGQLVPSTSSTPTTGRCPAKGKYDHGWHIRYMPKRGGGAQAGSVVGCPVCDDTGSFPVPSQRWGAFVR